MNVRELVNTCNFSIINEGTNMDSEITKAYCCDLLSIAMGSLPEGAAWVTVMSNINTLAVAALADSACIILSCGTKLDDSASEKAKSQGITVLATPLPSFDAALEVYKKING